MCRSRLCTTFTILALVCLSLLTAVGCNGSAATRPFSQNQMRATAVFENQVLTDAENRLMDAFDAKLLDPALHNDLDPYVKGARSAADRLAILARTPGTSQSAFNLILDEFFAALGPIAQANSKAAAAKHMPPTSQPRSLRESSLAAPAGHVLPSVISGYDAVQFNRR